MKLFTAFFALVSTLEAAVLFLAMAPVPAAAAKPAPVAAAVPAKVIPAGTKASAVLKSADAGLSPERRAVLATATRYLGTTEKTGHNDGPVIERWLKLAGASKGDPYCAAFVYGVGSEALGTKNPYPRSAWSPDMVAGGTKTVSSARGGDTFGIYFSDKGRVAHTGLIETITGNRAITIEANTSPDAVLGSAADRDANNGGGVWRKYRPLSTLYRTRSWLP